MLVHGKHSANQGGDGVGSRRRKYEHGNTSRLEGGVPACRRASPPLKASAPKYGSTEKTKEGCRVRGNHCLLQEPRRIVGYTAWQTSGNRLKSPKAIYLAGKGGPVLQQERADWIKGHWPRGEAGTRKGKPSFLTMQTALLLDF